MANLKQIEKRLRSLKLPYKVIDLGGDVFTVSEVVESGVDEEEVVKTLIIRTSNSIDKKTPWREYVNFVALAVRGIDRLDFKKVRKLFGSKSELAKAGEVLKVCGVPVGAVCPILLKIPVYFDEKVMGLSHVNMGSGDLTKGLEMEFSDLLKAVGKFQVEDLIKI